MSALQTISIVIGALALINLIAFVIVQSLGLHKARETVRATDAIQDGPSVQGLGSASPPGDDKPLSHQEINEVFAQMKASGGYKPHPPLNEKD